MACCTCCCGGQNCTEGQQGKCCCGGSSGTCCSASEYCCDGVCQSSPCSVNCTVTQGGLLNSGSGWLPRNASGGVSLPNTPPITFSYLLEQSQNCGGSNSNRQTGTLSCQFTLTQTTTVQFAISGRTENARASRDLFNLFSSAAGVAVGIFGFGQNAGCSFTNRSDSASVTLSPGTYTYNATVDTVDGDYHEGTAITFSITGTNPLP